MNTLPVLCATLSLLCSGVFNWDFEYTNRQEFIRGIKDCAVAYNSHLQDFRRVPLELTLVQALHESGADGNSRFAKEGNNFFGIKALDDLVDMVVGNNQRQTNQDMIALDTVSRAARINDQPL